MAVVETIQKTEQEAEQIIERAQKKAGTLLNEAKARKEKLLAGAQKDLEELRTQALTTQKDELRALYKRITNEGARNAEKLKIRLRERFPKAVTAITEDF